MEILPKNPVWVRSPHDGVHYPAVLLQGGATAAVGSGGQMPASVKVEFPVGTNVKALFPDAGPSRNYRTAYVMNTISPFYVEPIATDFFIRRDHENVRPLWTQYENLIKRVTPTSSLSRFWNNLIGDGQFQPQLQSTIVWVRRCEKEESGRKCSSSTSPSLCASADCCCCWYDPAFTVDDNHDDFKSATPIENIVVKVISRRRGVWDDFDVDVRHVEPIIADFENRRHHPKVLPIWDQFVRTVRGGGPNVYTAQAHSNHLKWTGHNANLQKKAEMVLLTFANSHVADPSGVEDEEEDTSPTHRSYKDISYETNLSEDVIAAFRKEAVDNRKAIAETRAHLRETIDRLQWLVEEERELKQRVMREVAKQSTIVKPEQTARRAIEQGMNADAVALKKAYDLATAVAKAKEAAKGRKRAKPESVAGGSAIGGTLSNNDANPSLYSDAVAALLSTSSTAGNGSDAPAPSPSASSSSAFLHQVSSTFTCSRCGALVPIAEGPAHRQHHFDEFERSFRSDVEAAERAALLDQRIAVGSVIEAENESIRLELQEAFSKGSSSKKKGGSTKREREEPPGSSTTTTSGRKRR